MKMFKGVLKITDKSNIAAFATLVSTITDIVKVVDKSQVNPGILYFSNVATTSLSQRDTPQHSTMQYVYIQFLVAQPAEHLALEWPNCSLLSIDEMINNVMMHVRGMNPSL